MNKSYRRQAHRAAALAIMAGGAMVTTEAAFAQCTGPGAKGQVMTCAAAVAIPGNPLRSFDISWVDPITHKYYLADRSNAAIDQIDTQTLAVTQFPGFVGVKLNGAGNVNNNISGPDGVVSHGKWLYAGDGNSTLHVIDTTLPPAFATVDVIGTGGTTRVDEMAISTDGTKLLAANNAEDPPFATLFNANGDSATNNTFREITYFISNAIMPAGFGLSMEQPAWEPDTQRFFVSLPVIANNPPGCNFGQKPGNITCDGGVAVINPFSPVSVIGPYDSTTDTGVVPLIGCGPNGAATGPNHNILLGCTPQNNPSDTVTTVFNVLSHGQTHVVQFTGADETWWSGFNDQRFYTGSSRACGLAGGCPNGGAVLGVIDETSVLVDTIPQSSNSHSVAGDGNLSPPRVFVPQVGTAAVVGSGGDTTTVGQGICGTSNGCVAVYTANQVDSDPPDTPTVTH